MFKYILLGLATVQILSCATPIMRDGQSNITMSEYENIVEAKTVKSESYSGLTNQLTVSATKIDSAMNEAILARSSQIYEWNSTVMQEEKTKASSQLATETEFFVSFYTPERAHNNLNSNKSIWKIYLDVGGVRYEGKATKVKAQLVDLQMIYPQHNRFSSPYKIEFPIATNMIESQSMTLTFTGPNATVKLNF
jgi:hypothetical protein